jgi:hypothetical protein
MRTGMMILSGFGSIEAVDVDLPSIVKKFNDLLRFLTEPADRP